MKREVIHVKNLQKSFRIQKNGGLKGLFKKSEYEEVVALKNIDLTIKEGEFVALLGPNGAGKSTLIKILIGVLAYNSGEVTVLGEEPLDNRRKIISKLGIVFGQRSRLWYDLPVKDSFELTKRLYIEGYPASHAAQDKNWEDFLIDSIDIRHLLDRQVKKLSLGEKMRCELVNTLLYNPNLIFLDEPTIGLDVVSKQKIREALKILHDQGKTILLTSHDTGDIEKLCERVVVINHGEVAVDLPIDQFMQLNDESELYVKVNNKLKSKDLTEKFKTLDVQVHKESDYEFKLVCKRTDFKHVVKYTFDTFDVADLKITSEGVEKILFDLYRQKEMVRNEV